MATGISNVNTDAAAGPTDLPAVDPRAYPDAEVIQAPPDPDRRVHPFEALQRRVLAECGIQATPGSLMLCSDLLSSVHRLEFVDPDIIDDQAARLVEIREKENPNTPQMWGPTAIKI